MLAIEMTTFLLVSASALFFGGSSTYEVVLGPQPVFAVLLQQPLEQLAPGVGHVGFEHQSLVQDVIVHLRCVPAVEGRLEGEHRGRSVTHTHRYTYTVHALATLTPAPLRN